MTLNDLRTNVFLFQKSTKVNSFRQEKDEEIDSLRKAKGKKEKGPMEDLDAEVPKSCDATHESLVIHLVDKKWVL